MDKLWFKARRVISVLLVFTMLASITPVQAFADDSVSAETTAADTTTEANEASGTDSVEQTPADTENVEETQVSQEEAEVAAPETDASVTDDVSEAAEPAEESRIPQETPQAVPQESVAAEAPAEAPAEEPAVTEPAADSTAAPAVTEAAEETAPVQEEPAAAAPQASVQTLTATAEGTTVSVTAELPAGAQVAVTKMSGDDLGDDNMQALMEAVNSNDIREIEVYDISLTDAQGTAYTLPEGRTAAVTLSGIALQAAEGRTLYAAHLKADGSADMGVINGDTVTFTVDSFSPFVVAAVGSAETAPAEDSVQEEPTVAPEASDEVDGASNYAAMASTYSSKYRNYFVNTTTDSNVEIWYSTDGQTLKRLANGGTISFARPAWQKDCEITAIQFYIVTKPGYTYQYCTFDGTSEVQDGVLALDDPQNIKLGFNGEVDFTQANQAAKELGAEYAFHFSGRSLMTTLFGGSDRVDRFLVSTNWDHETVTVVYHRNVSAADTTTVTLFAELNTAGTLWQGEMWNGQNGDKILVGWNTKQDGSGKQYALSDLYTPVEETQNLYAVWEEPTVTVTYDANGGSWSGNTLTETADKWSDYKVTTQAPSRNGYELQGWNTKADGSGTTYASGATLYQIQSDLTLYAQWKNVQKYSVAVTLSTASGTTLKTKTVGDVSWDTLSGYKTMAGYALANALLGTHFTAASGVTAAWDPADLSESILSYSVALTIADDSADLVKVHYEADGADGTVPADVTLVKGDSYTVASAAGLSKTGHTFGGWAYGDTAYNVDDTNNQNDTIAAVEQNLTLTARWNPIQYTVTWMNQDGTEKLGSTPVAYGNKPVYEGAVPTKDSTDGEAFTFAGWSKDKNQTHGTAAESLEVVTGDVTYYAAFSAQVRQYPYTINRVYRDTENNIETVKQSEGSADYDKQLSELVGTPDVSVPYGNTYYVYSGNDAEGKTIGTGSNVINLYYDVDTLVDTSLDKDNNPANGDGIADKYQITVTYQVVGGSWNDETTGDKTEVVTLMENGAYSENGTASLDLVPEAGENPNAGMYGDDSCWSSGAKPTAADRDHDQFVYTYQTKTAVTITFADDSLSYNGELQTGKDTFTSTLDSDLYTVAVEGYQAPQGKDVKAGGYQGNAKGATVTITEKATGTDVTYQYAVSYKVGTLTITAQPVTVALTAADKTYDGTTTVEDYTLTVNGAVEGETLTAAAQQVAFDSADAGDRTVNATGITLSDPNNYSLADTTAQATAAIAPKALNVTVSFVDRVYKQGDTTVQVAGASIDADQVIEDDVVTATATGTGTIAADSVRDDVAVTGDIQTTLGGEDAGNYTVGTVSYGTVNILGVVTYDTNAGDDSKTWTEEKTYHYQENVTPTEDEPTRYGYTFLGWSVDRDAKEPDDTFTMDSTGLKLFAVWQAQDVTITVTYHYGTQDPVTGTVPGKKFDETLTIGTGSNDLSLNAKTEYQGTAYTLSSVDMGNENLFTLGADNYQDPTFTHEAKLDNLTLTVDVYYMADNGGDGIPDQYQVTVHYAVAKGSWNDGTDAVMSETVTLLNGDGQWDENGSGALSEIPQAGALADAGYTAGSWDNDPQAAVIRGSDAGKTFTYTYGVDANQQYAVTYTAQANGAVSTAVEKLQVLGTAGLQGSAATPADGYVFDGWYKGDSKVGSDAVLSAETVAAYLNKTTNAHGETVYGNTEFSARFTIRTDLSYTVRYLEDGTGNVLSGEKTVGGQTFGTTVTETAPDIAGYTVTSDKNPQSLTIGTGDNVITFYYKAVGETVAAATAPTASPAPVTAPAAATTPAAPAAPTATTAPAATAAPEENVTEEPEEEIQAEETPLVPDAGEESIADEETPLAGGNTAWALLNLVLAVLTALGGVLLALGYLLRRKGNAWRLAALVPAIGAVAAFLLTEDMSLQMAFVDKWTLLMALLAVIQVVIAVLGSKDNQNDDDGEADA